MAGDKGQKKRTFDLSFLRREAAEGSTKEPAVKKSRTQRSRTDTASGKGKDASGSAVAQVTPAAALPPAPARVPPPPASQISQATSGSGTGSGSQPSSSQSLLTSSAAAWQKMKALGDGEDIQGFLRGKSSAEVTTDLNHDLFKVMVKSYAVFKRLGNTERTLANEREMLKKTLTELAQARDNEAIARAEKESVIEHERKTIEENKELKTERATVWKQFESAKAEKAAADLEIERLMKENEELRQRLDVVEEDIIEDFKQTDDFQACLKPVFMEGWEHAQEKFKKAFPTLDFSGIEPGEESDKESSGEREGDREKGPEAARDTVAVPNDQVSADPVGEPATEGTVEVSAGDGAVGDAAKEAEVVPPSAEATGDNMAAV